MSTPASIRAIIDMWPARRDLASDVQVSADRVHKWAQVGAIPARYHFAVITAGQARGFDVTADLMARLHAVAQEGQAA